MIESLVISLILTIIIESIVSFLLGIRGKENYKVIICANICTNPFVVYISNCVQIFNDNNIVYFVIVAILEILAVFVEYKLYKRFLDFNKISPFIISLVCNITSFGIGLVLSYLI